MKYWNFTFSTKLRQAPLHGLGSAHTKNLNSNWSSRSKNIKILTGYSKGAHIHAAPALTPLPHCRPWPLRLHNTCRYRSRRGAGTPSGGRIEISADDLIVFVRCLADTVFQTVQFNIIWAGVLLFDRQHDLIRCLGVWSTIYRIHKFWYYMHPESISVIYHSST